MFLLPNGEFYMEQSEHKCRMNLNTMGLEVPVDKVNTHNGKQRNEKNNRRYEEKNI